MIKKIFIVFMLVSGIISIAVAAEKKETGKEQEKPKTAEVKQNKEMAGKINDAEKSLNNTRWQVNFSQLTQAEKKEKFTDKISFKDGKVEIGTLASQGFPGTSFTITIKGDDNNIIVWETMQTSEKKGLAFLKGEIEEGRMRGVLSRHLDEKTVKDYSFYSTGKEVIQEEAPAVPQAVEKPVIAQESEKKDIPKEKGEDKKSNKK
jgi:hypothetical protein